MKDFLLCGARFSARSQMQLVAAAGRDKLNPLPEECREFGLRIIIVEISRYASAAQFSQEKNKETQWSKNERNFSGFFFVELGWQARK